MVTGSRISSYSRPRFSTTVGSVGYSDHSARTRAYPARTGPPRPRRRRPGPGSGGRGWRPPRPPPRPGRAAAGGGGSARRGRTQLDHPVGRPQVEQVQEPLERPGELPVLDRQPAGGGGTGRGRSPAGRSCGRNLGQPADGVRVAEAGSRGPGRGPGRVSPLACRSGRQAPSCRTSPPVGATPACPRRTRSGCPPSGRRSPPLPPAGGRLANRPAVSLRLRPGPGVGPPPGGTALAFPLAPALGHRRTRVGRRGRRRRHRCRGLLLSRHHPAEGGQERPPGGLAPGRGPVDRRLDVPAPGRPRLGGQVTHPGDPRLCHGSLGRALAQCGPGTVHALSADREVTSHGSEGSVRPSPDRAASSAEARQSRVIGSSYGPGSGRCVPGVRVDSMANPSAGRWGEQLSTVAAEHLDRLPPGRGAPDARGEQLDRVPGRVPDVDRPAAPRPGQLLLDYDPARRQAGLPAVQVTGPNTKGEVARPHGPVRRQVPAGGGWRPGRRRGACRRPRPGRTRAGPAPGRPPAARARRRRTPRPRPGRRRTRPSRPRRPRVGDRTRSRATSGGPAGDRRPRHATRTALGPGGRTAAPE